MITPKGIFNDCSFNFVQDSNSLFSDNEFREVDLSSNSKIFLKQVEYTEEEIEKCKRIYYGVLLMTTVLSSVTLLVIPSFPLNIIGASMAGCYGVFSLIASNNCKNQN
jgi:hypothetical protein